MSGRLELEAPTFTSLNKPQKRALVLRDQLRYVEPAHLNTFIEGITDDEPPTYTKINGITKPELAFVTLKEEAKRFDLGNVILPEGGNVMHHVHLVVDNGQIEMHADDPIPVDENDMNSVPIHGFIAKTTVDMFKNKYMAILTRVNKINEARRAAYNMPNLPPVMFHDGATLARLDPAKAEQGHNQVARRTRKREPNEEVPQHVSNKRKRTGLASISEDAKSKTFDTIPSHVKVDLFNSIVKTAFPNFDNLMVASWNVISIYQACGSDFPELHRSIVELRGVLQDFDEATGERADRTALNYRHDFGGPSQGGMDGDRQNGTRINEGHSNGGLPNGGRINEDRLIAPAPTHTQNGADVASQANDSAANENQTEPVQQQDEHDVAADLFGDDDDRTEPEMPPPRTVQLTQPQQEQAEEEEDDDDDDEVPAVDPRKHRLDRRSSTRQSSTHQPSPSYMADTHMNGSVPTSSETSPEPQQIPLPSDRVKKVRDQNAKSGAEEHDGPTTHAQETSPELLRRREEYHASSIGKASALANLRAATPIQSSRADDTDSHSERDRPAPPLHDQPTSTPSSNPKPKSTQRKKKMSDLTTEQIKTRLDEVKAKLLRTFITMDQIPEAKMGSIKQFQTALDAREKKAREREREVEREQDKEKDDNSRRPPNNGSGAANGMFGPYLGNSMLGAKKPMGVAPIAPMFPMGHKRDGYMASDRGERNGRNGGASPPNGRRGH